MAHDFRGLAALYKALGLETSSDLVERRIAGATSAMGALDAAKVCVLARAALELSLKDGELGWFLGAFREADRAFTGRETDIEIALLAAAVLRAAIEEDRPVSTLAALAVSTGGFGRIRPVGTDDELAAFAEQSLIKLQQRESAVTPKPATVEPSPDITGTLTTLQQAGEANQFNNGWTPIRNLISGLAEFVNDSQRQLVLQLNVMVEYQKRLTEETHMQWWVIGGWSNDEWKPFPTFNAAEAAIRAGKELAELTTLPAGPYGAPALLDLVLQKVPPGAGEPIAVNRAVTSCPAPWRRSWTSHLIDWPHAPLLPVSFAAALAADSDDAADWEPRFQRLTGIPATTEMSTLDLGLQVFRERLLRRLAD
jgi:hypothetical protein